MILSDHCFLLSRCISIYASFHGHFEALLEVGLSKTHCLAKPGEGRCLCVDEPDIDKIYPLLATASVVVLFLLLTFKSIRAEKHPALTLTATDFTIRYFPTIAWTEVADLEFEEDDFGLNVSILLDENFILQNFKNSTMAMYLKHDKTIRLVCRSFRKAKPPQLAEVFWDHWQGALARERLKHR